MTGEEKVKILKSTEKLWNEKNRLEELEKENAELKAQIEQLSNDNHVLKTSFIMQQEQIEKMKCCGNCKSSYKFEGVMYCKSSCKRFKIDDEVRYNDKCIDWECAE